MLRAQVRKALPCSDLWAPSPGPVSGSLTRRRPGRKGAGEAVQGPSPDHPAPRVRSAASRQEARAPSRTLGCTLDLGAVWGGGVWARSTRAQQGYAEVATGPMGKRAGPSRPGREGGAGPRGLREWSRPAAPKIHNGSPKGTEKGTGNLLLRTGGAEERAFIFTIKD